jgi:hypothetical protein
MGVRKSGERWMWTWGYTSDWDRAGADLYSIHPDLILAWIVFSISLRFAGAGDATICTAKGQRDCQRRVEKAVENNEILGGSPHVTSRRVSPRHRVPALL